MNMGKRISALGVPENSNTITFGILFSGTAHARLDEFKFEVVGKDVPVTGLTKPPLPKGPLNLGFEQEPDKKDATLRPKSSG